MALNRSAVSRLPQIQKGGSEFIGSTSQPSEELETLTQLHTTAENSIANREALQNRNRNLLQNMQVLQKFHLKRLLPPLLNHSCLAGATPTRDRKAASRSLLPRRSLFRLTEGAGRERGSLPTPTHSPCNSFTSTTTKDYSDPGYPCWKALSRACRKAWSRAVRRRSPQAPV